jgi:glycosyltransferase involved in cell wall biosynthesis
VTEVGSLREWKNREGLEEYAIRWNWVSGPSSSGFTAVLRVKNEARSLPWVLPWVLRSVEQAIVVDNGSTDETVEVARRVAAEAGLEERLRVLSYPFEVARCGPEHLRTFPDSVHSLTYFYNWSFSHVRTRYALKWDGDMVLTPQGERVLRDLAWQLEGIDGTVKLCRSPLYVESDRVAHVDLARTPGELWGWRNISEHTFIKCFDWEFVRPWADYLLQVPDWVCFELKWLDQDLFNHWSNTDFKRGRHSRKRREWEVNRALLNGTAPPEGVVRIESPDETHIIDHLRQIYTAMRQEGPTAPVPGDLTEVEDLGPPPVDGRDSEPALLPEQRVAPVLQPTQNEEIPRE